MIEHLVPTPADLAFQEEGVIRRSIDPYVVAEEEKSIADHPTGRPVTPHISNQGGKAL